MKKLILILAIALMTATALQSKAGGLSAWHEQTPYGHTIEHDGTSEGWVCLSLDDTTGVCFKHFYFYKGYTVAYSDSNFYIINEKTGKIKEFNNRRQWQQTIEQQGLEPFWKREYHSNYSSAFGDGSIFFVLFFPIPFLMPLLWLFCIFSLMFPWKRAKGFRKHYSWLYPTIIMVIAIYENFPQSI